MTSAGAYCLARSNYLRSGMHVITRKRLNELAARNPEAKSGLAHWYRTVKSINFASFAELRQHFPSTDKVGNSPCLTWEEQDAIDYSDIRAILTHAG